MPDSSVTRRRLLQTTGVVAVASAAAPLFGAAAEAAVGPARAGIGVAAYPVDLGEVRLAAGRRPPHGQPEPDAVVSEVSGRRQPLAHGRAAASCWA